MLIEFLKKGINNNMDEPNVEKTSIGGLLILRRPIHKDERGFFREIFHLNEIEEISGISFKGVQMNHAFSYPRVLRGIHAESWNKIICPINGEVFIAIVDVREDSPTFKKVETFIVNDENRIALFIPLGLANSYCILGSEPVHYIYLVDSYYDGSDTKAIAFDDPDLKIEWPVKDPIISERDKNNPKFRDLFPDKFK